MENNTIVENPEFFENAFVNSERENELQVFGVPLSPERIGAARAFIQSMLNNLFVYRSCDVAKGGHPKLVVAHVGKMDGNRPVIVVTPLLFPAGSELQNTIRSEIGNIRAFFHEHAYLPILFLSECHSKRDCCCHADCWRKTFCS